MNPYEAQKLRQRVARLEQWRQITRAGVEVADPHGKSALNQLTTSDLDRELAAIRAKLEASKNLAFSDPV